MIMGVFSTMFLIHHDHHLAMLIVLMLGRMHLDALLVGGGGTLVLGLVDLVTSGVESTRGTAGERAVTDVALGLLC